MIRFDIKEGRPFTLLNLSDPQMGHAEWADDHKSSKILHRTVGTVIERSHPDLITVSGDISYGGDFEAFNYFADYMDSFGIPWAICFGNHDNQGGADNICTVVEAYKKHPLFLYEPCDPALGNGNFVIGVYQGGKPVQAIFLMDTHDREPYKTETGEDTEVWAKLLPNQLEWYRERVAELEKAGFSDSTLITHIPIYAYREAIKAAAKPGVVLSQVKPENSTGSEFWNEGYEDSFGVCYEEVCSYPEDEGAFDVIKKLSNTTTLITGHDHVNNFVINYEGVRFVYSLKAGCGCYWDPVLCGGTVLTYPADGKKSVRHEYVDVSDLL